MGLFKRDEFCSTREDQAFITVALPDDAKAKILECIHSFQSVHNPYCATARQATFLASEIHSLLRNHQKCRDVAKLMRVIQDAKTAQATPSLLIRNGASDSLDTLRPPTACRGYAYGSNSGDRLKAGFVSEWFSWAIAELLNYTNRAHPSEHGGNNRFNIVSPIPRGDTRLRESAASIGGGGFPLHNDSTVYSGIRSRNELNSRLDEFNLDLEMVAKKVQRRKLDVVDQITCDRYLRVDALSLACVINGRTRTHVATLGQIYKSAVSKGLLRQDFETLSRIPVAHIAGPADGDISGFIGNISPPVVLNGNGNLVGTLLNSAAERMVCLSSSASDNVLFARFIDAVVSTERHEIAMRPGDLLFIPNAPRLTSGNALHGRERIADDDYDLVSHGAPKGTRRCSVRQYLQIKSGSPGHEGEAPWN